MRASACIPVLAVVFGPYARVAAESPDDILVIVNRGVATRAINAAELRQMFLGRRITWPGGQRIVPVNAKRDAVIRAQFRQRVLGMTDAEEERYWQERAIRGGGSAPAEFQNVQLAVFKLKGGISYVRRAEYKANVTRVLLTLPRQARR